VKTELAESGLENSPYLSMILSSLLFIILTSFSLPNSEDFFSLCIFKIILKLKTWLLEIMKFFISFLIEC